MMVEKNSILSIQLNQKISPLTKFYKELIEALYELFCFILDDPVENFWYECISLSLGYFQLLIYIIDETVSSIKINIFF